MKKQSDALADTLGKGYAHLQHGIDRLIGWGFKKMRDTDVKPQEHPNRIVRAGRGALSFIGRMGDAYFEAYDALKRRKE